MRQLDTFTAPLPDGRTESRQSSRPLRLAVVVASTAEVRAGQLEASIAEHRALIEADLRNDGIRHDSRKETRRVAAIRDAEVVADVQKLEALRELPAETLVEAAVWGWYEDRAAADRGAGGARTLYPVVEVVELVAGEIAGDAPAEKVGVVFPTEIKETCPNAADEPGGTETPTKEHKMAKHINTATVRTAKGDVELTKTSTHRDYVVASGFEMADGTQLLAAWHLTEEAARKAIASAAMMREAGRREAKTILIPVRNEVVLTKKEQAELDAANAAAAAAEAEGVELEVVETARPVEEAPAKTVNEAVADVLDAKTAALEAETEAPVKWGMGTHTAGDVVVSKDGLEWTVIGPAEKGKTVRLERTVDGVVKVRLSFHYNITKK